MFSCWLDVSPNIDQKLRCASTTGRNNWLQRSSGMWKYWNIWYIADIAAWLWNRFQERGKGSCYMGVTMFFFLLETTDLDAAESFWFLFFQLFGPEDVLWTRSSIYNAAMHSPCTVADDFDHQLATGQTLWTCWVSVSDFSSLVWMAIYWPQPFDHTVWEAQQSLFRRTYFLLTRQVLPTILKNPRIKILLAWSKFLAWSLHLAMLLYWLLC